MSRETRPSRRGLVTITNAVWHGIVDLGLRDLARSRDKLLVRSALGVIALPRGLGRYGSVLLDFTEDELDEMVSEYRSETS